MKLETFAKKNEIIEGLLTCVQCNGIYPIILSIPILVEDLSLFLSIRAKLGVYLLLNTKNTAIKSLIKKSLKNIKKVGDDTTDLEKNWVGIYKKSRPTTFETKIKNAIRKLPRCSFVVEHGCSIGTMSEILSRYHGMVFGVDKSFFALLEAKKQKIKNADFFLADSLSTPFGTMKFDLVVALNVLELVEPLKLLKIVGNQSRKFVLLSDTYDYDRGKNSVKVRLDEKTLRSKLRQMGFKLIAGTAKPSFIPWKLQVNQRLELNYKTDLILASL